MFLKHSVGCVIIAVFITSHYANIIGATRDKGGNNNEYCKTVELKHCHKDEVREKCPNRCAIVVALYRDSKDKGYAVSAPALEASDDPEDADAPEDTAAHKGAAAPKDATASDPRNLERAENKNSRAENYDSVKRGSKLSNQKWCKYVDIEDCQESEVKLACPGICNVHDDGPTDEDWCTVAVDANDCSNPDVRKSCPITCKADQRIDKEWCQWVVDEPNDCQDSDILKDCPEHCKSLDKSSPAGKDEIWCEWAVQLPECSNERIFKSCPVFCKGEAKKDLHKKDSQTSPDVECGRIRESSRIIGGKNAALYEYPWIVGVFNKYVFHCGGSLINKDWVLTAAHCFREGGVEDFFVTLGDYDLRTDDETKSVLRNLSVIIVNQGFDDPVPYANDIAVIKMEKPVTFGERIAPICLPSPVYYDNAKATIIGWGQTKEASGASILQETTVKIMANGDCKKSQTRNWLYRIIRDDWICAHRNDDEPAADACKGDSGGPLMVVEKGHWVQVGITSWGNGCALKENPGVYTRVSSFLDWIKTNTNERTRCKDHSNAICHERTGMTVDRDGRSRWRLRGGKGKYHQLGRTL